jgi:hypothetical protein
MWDQYPRKHLIVYWLDGVLDCDLAPVELILCFVQDWKYQMAQQKVQYWCAVQHHLGHGNELYTRLLLWNTGNKQSCSCLYAYNTLGWAQQGTEDEQLLEEYVLDSYLSWIAEYDMGW